MSLLPLILFVVLLFLFNIKLIWASLVSLVTTLILLSFIWMMDPSFIFASIIKGLLVSVDIFLIVFGALLFIEVLSRNNIIENLCAHLSHVSRDYRIQVILLSWFLENFLEGTSGFGTPVTIVTPILVGIGLSPLLAVSVALLGNGAAGVFGAAGTPIRVGLAGLDIAGVALNSALLNIVSSIVPVFMLYLITKVQKNGRLQFSEALPFALFAGLAFTLPSILFVFLGPEFPSILGSVLGLFITLIVIKLKILIPANIRTLKPHTSSIYPIPLRKVLSPYVVLIGLLIVSKFGLSNISFSFDFGLKHIINVFNPGLAFIATSILVSVAWKTPVLNLYSLKKTVSNSLAPFLIVVLISIMVQLMLNSSQNISGHVSALQYISDYLQTSLLPIIAPFLGAFGSFLTGSATISNLMFGGILESASVRSGLAVSLILSLQAVGAAAGNIISLADVLPALTIVGIKGQETKVIKKVIIPCIIYVIFVGIVGLSISLLT